MIKDEEYVIVGTGKCNAIAHRNSTNPFCLMLNRDAEASIEYIRIYKEQDKADSDQKEQRDIYTAQATKPNEATQQSSTNNNPQAQENQNLIHIEAHLTSGIVLKKDIQWGYYIKQRNENLKSKITIKDLKSFTFVSNDAYNTKVSFDINTKFTYTITENNTQKEVEDYLKEKHQLIIFAYRNNPVYNVGERITHTILTISTLPIIEIGYNTLTLWHNDIKEIFHIDNTIMPHLIKDFTEDTQYTLGYNIQNDYLALKSNSKLYKIHKNNPNNTQSPQDSSNNTTQQNNTDSIYLKESKDFENLKNTLYPTSQQIYQEVKVWVWIRQCTQMFSLNKPQGRIVKIEIPKENVSDSIIANTESNQTRILKSWANTNQKITEQDIRIIALSTIDIINRKDMSKNPLIYKALDKLISDYQIYKDNFPQEYYVEFGRYMVESGIQKNKGILYIRILETLTDCCKLIAKSRMFGEVEYKNGGVAIFHLYENYVPKFEGDENGLDKVSHFLFSALMAFRDNVIAANIASVSNEIVDYLSLNAKKAYNKLFNNKIENYGTGFDMSDIQANNAGISYGAELKERAIKGIFQ